MPVPNPAGNWVALFFLLVADAMVGCIGREPEGRRPTGSHAENGIYFASFIAKLAVRARFQKIVCGEEGGGHGTEADAMSWRVGTRRTGVVMVVLLL